MLDLAFVCYRIWDKDERLIRPLGLLGQKQTRQIWEWFTGWYGILDVDDNPEFYMCLLATRYKKQGINKDVKQLVYIARKIYTQRRMILLQ